MKFFVDTANVADIKKANDLGVICGVTTNPSLIAKEGRDFTEVIKEITSIVDSGRRVRRGRCSASAGAAAAARSRTRGRPWRRSPPASCSSSALR